MNRRKLFGILAAAPAAVVAASAVKKDSLAWMRFGFPDYKSAALGVIPPVLDSQFTKDPLIERKYKPKCYSVWDYQQALHAFKFKYLSEKHRTNCDSFPCMFGSAGLGDMVKDLSSGQYSDLGLETTSDELRQAFADACMNGEVPGVWWE